MASVFHLYNDAFNIKQEIVNRYVDFAEENKKLYFSAVIIQRNWRGYYARLTIKRWHKSATTIQRYVRGFLVRWHLPELYEKYFKYISLKYYNLQASKIQALWKGYQLRKKISVKKNVEERARLAEINEEMRKQIEALFEILKEEHFNEANVKKRAAMKQCIEFMFDRHHLLRTYHREGVLSIHGSTELSHIEKILKNFPYKDYMTKIRKLAKELEETEVDDAEVDDFDDKKPFSLVTKIKDKPYERLLMTQFSDKIL